jgi:hypothetical protein
MTERPHDLPECPGGGRSALGGGRRECRGRNLYQKIIEAHLGSGVMKPGSEIGLIVDSTLTHNRLGVMTSLQYEAIGIPQVSTKLPSLTWITDPAGHVRERRRPPLPGNGHRPVGHPPLPSRQRHRPSGPPGAFQPARLDPARRRQPYPHMRRGGDAGRFPLYLRIRQNIVTGLRYRKISMILYFYFAASGFCCILIII